MTTQQGRFHCGAIRFEIDGEIDCIEICSCSISAVTADLHWYVPPDAFRLSTDAGAISRFDQDSINDLRLRHRREDL